MCGNFAKHLIAFGLICLSFSASGQQFIQLLHRGDTITLDSAVVMDVGTYRKVRSSNSVGLDLAREQQALNKQLEHRIKADDSLIAYMKVFMLTQETMLAEKDETIASLSQSFHQVDATTRAALEKIGQLTGETWWDRNKFWIGFGTGVVGAAVIKQTLL